MGPVGRASIQRIENPIAPLCIEEALGELPCWVIDDGKFFPAGYLLEKLFYQCGLPVPVSPMIWICFASALFGMRR